VSSLQVVSIIVQTNFLNTDRDIGSRKLARSVNSICLDNHFLINSRRE
jgi:hypothetical protein